ncbi:hypothetical protein A5N82_11345 [Christensenella minuta]|uniref:Uncharacterized protein n=1 Tax=Christensenella minuta TaxID=626937 RepID=A0A136Q6G3_9FIRM|nr:hypothetical protein B1H56_01985 [Christensenella minuta]KXK66275.1 hypothetical protein HMPREF3293_01012 [Christensenella minuta]OAQ41259.1 hypothetical protein A5N82_11345 [Christensenella minuta]
MSFSSFGRRIPVVSSAPGKRSRGIPAQAGCEYFSDPRRQDGIREIFRPEAAVKRKSCRKGRALTQARRAPGI